MICLQIGKTYTKKTHRVILRSPLSRIYYYHNKRLQVKESQYLIPTYSWTLTPIPNWTCFVMTISLCNALLWVCDQLIRCTDLSTRLTHQLKKDIGYKVFQFITRWRSRNSLITEPYDTQTLQLLQEKDELGQILSSVTICMNTTLLHTCAPFDGP